MQIRVVENYDEASRAAAEIVIKVISERHKCVLGLATGETPIGMYKCLIDAYNDGRVDFSEVKTINLDEYYPITPDNEQSYRYFMNKQLFNHVNIDKANTYVPDGTAKDAALFCREYESLINELGGADVQVLGIGRNGHIGFNEPDAVLCPDTHLTALTESTIEANSRFFENESDVPKHAITMGMRSIFKAKKILVIATGEGKADAVKTMLSGITTDCPASLLCLHPDVVLVCDKAAYSRV